jgi:hypothetical protein
MVLIVTNIGVITIEALSHLEDSCSLVVLTPEILRDLWDSVDTDTIETVLLNNSVNPILEVLSNIGVTLIEIRESSETTVFNLPLIVPVINIAV